MLSGTSLRIARPAAAHAIICKTSVLCESPKLERGLEKYNVIAQYTGLGHSYVAFTLLSYVRNRRLISEYRNQSTQRWVSECSLTPSL